MENEYLSIPQENALETTLYKSPGYLPETVLARYFDRSYLLGLSAESQEKLQGKTYFLVEDDPETIVLIVRFLASHGYLCLGFSNGLIGTQRLESIVMASDFVILTNDLELSKEYSKNGRISPTTAGNYISGQDVLEFIISPEVGYEGRIVGLGSPREMGYLPSRQVIGKYDLVKDDAGIQGFERLALGLS